MKILNRKNLILMISFALLMFECMTTLTFLDARSAVSAAESAVGLHYSNYLFFLGGYLIYAVLGHQLNASNKKALLISFSLLYLLTITLSQAQTSITVFCITSFLATAFLGFLGSIMYSLLAMNLAGSVYTGRILAISQSLAMLLQYAAMKTNQIPMCLILSGIVSLILTIYLKQSKEISFDFGGGEIHSVKTDDSLKKELIAAVVLILCLEFISAFNDGFYVRLFASGKIDLYGAIRLMSVIGFLLAGFLADFKDRRYFAISVICVYMMAVFAPILLADQKFQYINLGLMYLYLSFLVMYFNVTFFDIAAKSDSPEFYAPLGRIIDTVTSILFSLFAVSMNTYAVLAVHLVLLVIAWSIQIWKAQSIPVRIPAVNDDRTMEEFIQSCSLTEREQDVARRILVKSESIKEMSAELYISERVIYRHLSRIYEKTGTDSRMGLLLKYQEYLTKHHNH